MAAGLDIQVLTTDPSNRLPTHDLFHGVPVRRVPVVPLGSDYYLAPALTRVIRRGAPWDLVHIHSYQTLVAPLAMGAACRAGIPFLLTFHSGGHSSAWRHATRGLQVAALGPLIRAARRLVAVSEFELDLFSRRLGIPRDRFVLIPNGAQMPAAVQVAPDADPLIASVGRLERYKGHHRVLAALPHVLAEFPGAKLRIAGQGPYESHLAPAGGQEGLGPECRDRLDTVRRSGRHGDPPVESIPGGAHVGVRGAPDRHDGSSGPQAANVGGLHLRANGVRGSGLRTRHPSATAIPRRSRRRSFENCAIR